MSSPNSIYSRWLPGCLPRCMACCGLRPKNAINSPSRRSGELTDKVLSIIHTVPNLARINVCLCCSSLSFVCSSRCGPKLALRVAHYNPALFGKVPARAGWDGVVSQGVRTVCDLAVMSSHLGFIAAWMFLCCKSCVSIWSWKTAERPPSL